MDFKERMIEAYERGECGYEDAYDYVRESLADRADFERKRAKADRTKDGGGEKGAEGASTET